MIPSSQSKPKLNIVFIILDTFRADRLGCYGYPRGTSPNLDAYARSSLLFENAIAPAQWTIPSHASMFTGLPPGIHQVTQANSVLDARFTTFAEILSAIGYETVGFCNNPLLGLIHNNLRRGFQKFYNYSGTTPNIPHDFPKSSIYPVLRAWEHLENLVRILFDPIQNKFATSNSFLQAATHPFFVPLWTRFSHFKGHTPRSIHDVVSFLEKKSSQSNPSPYLLFFNLMETHLPYQPPSEFVHRFAPHLRDDRQASAFMRTFNSLAMQWLIPLKKPFTELEARTLSGLYDAEVAYQDQLLGKLFEQLNQSTVLDNTLVIIAADHGEMLGEHQFMGHAFGVYNELIRVPLIIHMPGQREGRRESAPVLTSRLFETILDAAGVTEAVGENGIHLETRMHSLLAEFGGQPVVQEAGPSNVICEAYSPNDAILMMEHSEPELIEKFHTRETHRAVYSNADKLYDIEGVNSRLLNFGDEEKEPEAQVQEVLTRQLEHFLQANRDNLPEGWEPQKVDLSDPLIEEHMRNLGYMA